MQLYNIQDNLSKAPLAQMHQERPAEVARAVDSTHVRFNNELARQADEVVVAAQQTENASIREDSESDRQAGNRRRRRRHQFAEQESEAEPENPPEAPADPSAHIDITI